MPKFPKNPSSFKMKGFSYPGESPVKNDEESKFISMDDYKANTDTLQAFQHQNLGKPDPAASGVDVALLNFIEQEHGKDSKEYKTFKSKKRVRGDETDFKAANEKLKGHKISMDSYWRAHDKYWNKIPKY